MNRKDGIVDRWLHLCNVELVGDLLHKEVELKKTKELPHCRQTTEVISSHTLPFAPAMPNDIPTSSNQEINGQINFRPLLSRLLKSFIILTAYHVTQY